MGRLKPAYTYNKSLVVSKYNPPRLESFGVLISYNIIVVVVEFCFDDMKSPVITIKLHFCVIEGFLISKLILKKFRWGVTPIVNIDFQKGREHCILPMYSPFLPLL